MRTRTTAVAVMACLALAACGSDAGDDAVTTAAPETTAAASTTTPPTTEPPTTEPPTTEPPTTEPPTTEPLTTEPPTTVAPVFAFPSADALLGWSVVNDTVMGGVSTGDLAWVDDALVFTGDLSLENNGGFASVRSPFVDPGVAARWAERPGPRVVVQGDGRTWTVEVRTDAFEGGWITTIATSPDELTDVELPWSSFEPVTRFLDPREADGPLDPAGVVSIAFYLVDGIEGPFRLDIRSVS